MTDDARNSRDAHWMRRRPLGLTAAAIVLLFLVWLVARNRGPADDAEVAAIVTAGTATAQIRDFPLTVAALGRVQPRPGSAAQLAAPAPTRVDHIYVGTGDHVTAGQPLVALDSSVWTSQTRQAEAALKTAQQAHDRASRLVSEGVLARKDEEVTAADLAQTRAALAEARQRESLATLRSPIDGVVTAMHASLSQPVDANQTLVEVIDPSGLEVLFHLSPDNAARVKAGAAVALTSDGDSAAAFIGSGSVRGVSASVDSVTATVAVRATIIAPTRELRVGETVGGRITVAEHEGAIVVPASALVPSGEGSQVFVVDDEGIAHATPVIAGARTGEDVEIISGLEGGETLVTTGAYGVSDGARIQAGEGG